MIFDQAGRGILDPSELIIKNSKLKRNVYNTGDSQVVTHQSTNAAQHCLTSVIRWELVLSVWYGRRRLDVQWRKNLESIAKMIFS